MARVRSRINGCSETSMIFQDSTGVEERAGVVFVVIWRGWIQAADSDHFGGLDKRLITKIDSNVRYPFRSVITAPPTKEKQIAFLQFGKFRIERHLSALANLLTRVAIQFD